MENLKAQRYRKTKLTIRGARTALSALFVFTLLQGKSFGLGRASDLALYFMYQYENPWIQAFLFTGTLLVLYEAVIGLPFSILSGYVVERHFGMSTQCLDDWFYDHLKGVLVGAVIGSLILALWLASVFYTENHWWWIFGLVMTAFSVVLTRLAPQLIIPLFFKLKPLNAPELQSRMKEISEKSGTSLLGIYEIDMSRKTTAANAAVVGFGGSRKALVGDTLLKDFTSDEVEFVLTHELGHHHNNDIWRGIILGSISSFALYGFSHILLQYMALDTAVSFPIPKGVVDAFHPILIFWFFVIYAVLSALVSPLMLWHSRIMERKADFFAVKMSGKAAAGIGSFEKLGTKNLAVFNPPKWEVLLFHSHPPIQERIRNIKAMSV